MKVIVRNYTFPIIFSYRGWAVGLQDASSSFQFSDVKVRVTISVDSHPYYSLISNAFQRQPWKFRTNSSQAIEQIKQLYQVVSDFIDTKTRIDYIETANGGIIDRFLGQNLSAVEKVQKKVKSYIDTNLGTADYLGEFLQYLKKRV